MNTAPTLNKPIFMREEVIPALTPALESSISNWLSSREKTDSKAILSLRQAAFSTLKKIGLPHSGSEDFTFIRTGEFLPSLGIPLTVETDLDLRPTLVDLEPYIFPECRVNYAVLLNGVFAPDLSTLGRGFQVKPLNENIPPSLLTNIASETDAVATLAMLYAEQPLLIEISTEASVQNPLQLLNYQTKAKASAVATDKIQALARTDTFVVVQSKKLSEGRILVRHVSAPSVTASSVAGLETQPARMVNAHTLALIAEGASLHYLESGSEGNEDGIHFRKLTAEVERASRLSAFSANTGSKLMRNSFSVDLNGSGAEAEIHGATVLTHMRQAHTFVCIRHRVPQCTSRQHFKSVAADQSKSSVDGTIFVAKDAQGTSAYQLINNLMLSDEARTDSKPQLMIFADDVKCSHGATTGKLDPAQQFYLESRGLNPVQAKTLLTVAFIGEILEKAGKEEAKDETKVEGTSLSFRSTLDHALLDALKLKLPETQGGQNATHR